MNRNPIFCALDLRERETARRMVGQLAPMIGGVKLGLEFFAANGPAGVQAVMDGVSLPLFLDLKLHDIPNTVAGAITALLPLAPSFTTVHAAGGLAMLKAAVAAAEGRTRVLAVTMLTSLTDQDLSSLGVVSTLADQVERLAELAQRAEIDGLVCSAHEVTLLRRRLGPKMFLMVPGIRPTGAEPDDQRRVLSPRQALAAGADGLVIGRPITASADPVAAAQAILQSLETA